MVSVFPFPLVVHDIVAHAFVIGAKMVIAVTSSVMASRPSIVLVTLLLVFIFG
jgi:hypothetical protein